MEIKYNLHGLLIYQTMILYFLAFIFGLLKYKRPSLALYFLGFLTAFIAVIYRGINVNHFPLQTMFEIFLVLGALVFPLSLISVKFINAPDYIWDIFIGIIVLFPAGFVFPDGMPDFPPALQSILFVPHVLVYMFSYIIMAKASVLGIKQLIFVNDYETTAYKFICLGFPFLTLGLILGSVWAKLAWGDYWSWDPKELWSLATWLVYAAYFHYRAMYPNNRKINSIWIITGFVFIIITILWVNLSRIFEGMHNYS